MQETRCKTCRTGTINAKFHATMLPWNFATNAPDAPHWTTNSCFVAFRSVWVHLGPFRYCMKFGAKWAELMQLMQKFVPRSWVGIFRNDHTRPTHRTPNSCFGVFHSVREHLGLFSYDSKLGAKWAEVVQLMQKFMPRSRVVIFRNECTRSTQLDRNLMFWCVS